MPDEEHKNDSIYVIDVSTVSLCGEKIGFYWIDKADREFEATADGLKANVTISLDPVHLFLAVKSTTEMVTFRSIVHIE